MKKIVFALICSLVALTSCMPEGEETELSSKVALLSFGIKNDLKTYHTVTTGSGKDSTYTTTMKGSVVKFTIDHENGLVYNRDSIAYGTKVSAVLVDVTADGYVCYLKENGEEGAKEDSIDFTRPVTFKVMSYDNQFVRNYQVSVNVRQIDPTLTQWDRVSTDFPTVFGTEAKAFVKGDLLYVIGKSDDEKCYATSFDGEVWSEPILCEGLPAGADCVSALLCKDRFLMTAGGELFVSDDAVTWKTMGVAMHGLLAVETDSVVWGVMNDELVSSVDLANWKSDGEYAGGVFGSCIASFSDSLNTNNSIKRTTFVTLPVATDEDYAHVWSKLSSETKWQQLSPTNSQEYGCPLLENLSVIRYAGNLYAIGAKGLCYESVDNGIAWKVNKEAFRLPMEFKNYDEAFFTVVEGEYVWIMWSASGEVWRGRWNGLSEYK